MDAMAMKHSREQARQAKLALLEHLAPTEPHISVGIGMNTEGSDYALTVSVDTPDQASAVPDEFQGLEVKVISDHPFVAYAGK